MTKKEVQTKINGLTDIKGLDRTTVSSVSISPEAYEVLWSAVPTGIEENEEPLAEDTGYPRLSVEVVISESLTGLDMELNFKPEDTDATSNL